MNASKPVGTIMILPESTEENVGTQKKPKVATTENSGAQEKTSMHSVKGKEIMDLDIGQFNLHMSNINKTSINMNSCHADISDAEFLKNVRKLGQICQELSNCCSNMEGIILKRIKSKNLANSSSASASVNENIPAATDSQDKDFLQENPFLKWACDMCSQKF